MSATDTPTDAPDPAPDLTALHTLATLGTAHRAARTALYTAVRTAITDHGVSQREAAARTGLNRQTIARILGKG